VPKALSLVKKKEKWLFSLFFARLFVPLQAQKERKIINYYGI